MSCHAAESAAWTGSHHDLAMQEATNSTVLGDFNDATFTHEGVASTFSREGDAFRMRTVDAHGASSEFRITHTFGVDPLQQYLVSFPDGRMQVLPVAWDSRPRDAGGQRWLSLEDPAVSAGQHWTTGLSHTWNSQCATCHSTGVQKHFDLDTRRYDTTWSDLDVACEACHGPGSNHVAWAENPGDDLPGKGLALDFQNGTEVEICAACHSQRTEIASAYPTENLLDSRVPALITKGLYHADGQPAGDVHVYGSFRQSREYAHGVTCHNCHDPHSLKLRAEGNALCATCHQPETFDTPEHHHHAAGSTGAECINCHMPEYTVLGVDTRREHAFRIPRPDLTPDFGTPNACNDCHTDRTAGWATGHWRDWYGDPPPHPAAAFHAAWTGGPNAGRMIAEVATNRENPAILRASALHGMRSYLNAHTLATVQAALQDPDPVVRRAAVSVFEVVQPRARFGLLSPMLRDSVLAVRAEAGRVLMDTPREALNETDTALLKAGTDAYRQTQLIHLELPQTHLNLGVLAMGERDYLAAEGAYRQALSLDSTFTAAAVNLADLFLLQNREAEAERILRGVVHDNPGADGGAHHALGLLLVRRGDADEGLEQLRLAMDASPEIPRYAYAYGIALHSGNESNHALEVLEFARQQHPGDRQILFALVTIARDLGWDEGELMYARQLNALDPDDPMAAQLLKEALERK